MDTIICKNCKKEFQNYLTNKRKFCSAICYWDSLKGNKLHLGYKHTEEEKIKCGNGWRGKKRTLFSEKWRKKMSRSHKGIMIGFKHSEETKRKISDSHRGKKAYQWKGNNVGYSALHKWVRKNLGKPKSCECCGKKGEKCGKKWNIHWANKSGKYLRKLTDWISLCVKCHKNYDAHHRRSLI